MDALIVMDLQHDMCDGGPFANINSLNIIPIINSLRDNYKYIFYVKKMLPISHCSLKRNGGHHPTHCIVNTHGCNLHNDLIVDKNDMIINICTQHNYNSNSAFFDDEETQTTTKLKYLLNVNNIKNLYFCGNNFETSIFSTIIDAFNYKFNCYIILDAIGYINKDECDKKMQFLNNLCIGHIYSRCSYGKISENTSKQNNC